MQPRIITETMFDGDMSVDRYVEQIHDDFEGCYNPNGCGQITFIGNIVASTEVVTTERAAQSSLDWANFIRSMDKKVWAIALTLIKKRGHLVKETVYITARYNDVIFYTSSFDGYGNRYKSKDSYWSVEHILGPVLTALGIKY